MRFILTFLFSVLLILPTSNMFASNESLYKNIDFSNVDLVGIIKNKGKSRVMPLQ